MLDRYDRIIEYVRISVTDRCNFRCKYCMPKEGVQSVSHNEILTYDEITRVARILADLGIRKIKLTGGEPLVRKNLDCLVKDLKSIEGIDEVTLTTNGFLLSENAERLKNAGIDCINVSLDTLSHEKFIDITGIDGISQVLKGIDDSLKLGIKTRVNAVTLKDYNYDEVTNIAELAKDRKLDVRFIEMMPIGLGKTNKGYSSDDVLQTLEAAFGEGQLISNKIGNGPATYYQFKDFSGKVGFISAISHKFCDNCNRVRLTSEGLLKPCLYYDGGEDLRELLRAGKTDEYIRLVIEKAIYNKPIGHDFSSGKTDEERLMSKIGG